eukprot:4128916-Pleurochrysis_carterae.AAC.2
MALRRGSGTAGGGYGALQMFLEYLNAISNCGNNPKQSGGASMRRSFFGSKTKTGNITSHIILLKSQVSELANEGDLTSAVSSRSDGTYIYAPYP